MAQGLVFRHLAMLLLAEIREAEESNPFPAIFSGFGFAAAAEPDTRALKKQALKYLKKSLQRDPTNRVTHSIRYLTLMLWKQPDDAAKAARELLEHVPDDAEALQFLVLHHLKNDDPLPAQPLVRRLRELKPLDPSLRNMEWSVLINSARTHARKKKWDQGRAAFDEADRVKPEDRQSYHVLGRRAIFELKAGNTERAEALIEEAQTRIAEPTPLWLLLDLQAIRYSLPKPKRERFTKLLNAGIKGKCRGDSAGEMARLLEAYLLSDQNYRGRATHLKLINDYIRRCTRNKFQEEDLRAVCSFLIAQEKNYRIEQVLEKMINKGLKNFPNSPHILYLAGDFEIEKGPILCDIRAARRDLEKALKIVRESNDPEVLALEPQIKQRLTFLAEVTEQRLPGPATLPPDIFGNLGGIFGEMDLDEYDDEFDDDDDGEDDLYDDEPPPQPKRATSGSRKPKPKKKRKR